MKSLLILSLLIFVSCSKGANFGEVISSSSVISDESDDVVIRVEDPREAVDEPEQPGNSEQPEQPEKPETGEQPEQPEKPETGEQPEQPEKPESDDISDVACKVDVKVTSAGNISSKSKLKRGEMQPEGSSSLPALFDIHLRNSEAIEELKKKLSESELSYIDDAAQGLIAASSGFSQTSVKEDIKLAFKETGKVKATSVHNESIIIYAEKDLEVQFTSVKAKRLIIVARGSVNLKTTSFDVDHAVILVEQDDDSEQNICVRETSAGSFDITLDAPENGSGLIISGGTSFKNTKIESTILGAGSAAQKWKATSIQDSEFLISNQVSSKSQSSLKFTALRNSKVKIDELSSEANVNIRGTSVRSSELKVENFSTGGTLLKTQIAHCSSEYTNGDIFLAFSGALEDIGASCK